MSVSAAPAQKAGTPIIQQVLTRILQWPEGQPVSGADLAEIADRKIVESALRTLVNRGEVVRIIPGFFAKPLPAGFEPRRQTLIRLVGSAFAQMSHIAVPDGRTAAFALGLIPQAPILTTFVTTAAERTLEVGRVRVTLVNADPWWFVLHDRTAGEVIRALGWAGASQVADTWNRLCQTLPTDVIDEVQAVSARLPDWMASTIAHTSVTTARS